MHHNVIEIGKIEVCLLRVTDLDYPTVNRFILAGKHHSQSEPPLHAFPQRVDSAHAPITQHVF